MCLLSDREARERSLSDRDSLRIGPIVYLFTSSSQKGKWPEETLTIRAGSQMGSGMTGILAVVVLVGFFILGCVGAAG